jgi:hypothetical protein
VLLGYSSSHLSYRCLDLSSHRIYISRPFSFMNRFFCFLRLPFRLYLSSLSPSPRLLLSPIYHSSPSFQLYQSQPHLPSALTYRSPHHHLHLCLLIILQV